MSTTRIEVATEPPYEVVVGVGATEQLTRWTKGRGSCVLADRRAAELHGEQLGLDPATPLFLIEPGENSKRLEVLGDALEFLVASGLDRTGLLVTLGGGVASDLGGLAASLYLRGIDVLHVPTTLLAQCDAAIGGKTAVNLEAGKNLAGTFHQPCAVLADPRPLATLPPEELRSGLGEVLKTALIGDAALFTRLERLEAPPDPADGTLLADLVRSCVRVKANIVAEDERERGSRAMLNLGHTFAHGMEHAAGFGVIPHGEAVGLGILLAARAAEHIGLLRDAELPERLRGCLVRLGLVSSIAELRERTRRSLEPNDLMNAMGRDKKGRCGTPRFVLPLAPEEILVGTELGEDLLRGLLA